MQEVKFNKPISITEQEVNEIKEINNKKSILKILLLNGKLALYEDLIQQSILYNEFFDKLRTKYNLPINQNVRIDFDKKFVILE